LHQRESLTGAQWRAAVWLNLSEAIRKLLELGWEKDSDALLLQCSFSLETMEWQNLPILS
jgi:hypothetical protein